MAKTSPQTKSFVILFLIAIIGTYLSVRFYNNIQKDNLGQYQAINYEGQTKQNEEVIRKVEASELVDTSIWLEYTNEKYNFSFKYKPDWKVLQAKAYDNYDLIEIDPGRRFYNIKIYISPVGFAAMGGLPQEQVRVDGVVAKNVSDMLYGIKHGELYYTFDLGLSVSLADDFNTLVSTLSFTNE